MIKTQFPLGTNATSEFSSNSSLHTVRSHHNVSVTVPLLLKELGGDDLLQTGNVLSNLYKLMFQMSKLTMFA